jgi:hypothetical protein
MNVPSPTAPAIGAQYDLAVARKILDSEQQQGQQALELIQSASPPRNVPDGVGRLVNVVA